MPSRYCWLETRPPIHASLGGHAISKPQKRCSWKNKYRHSSVEFSCERNSQYCTAEGCAVVLWFIYHTAPIGSPTECVVHSVASGAHLAHSEKYRLGTGLGAQAWHASELTRKQVHETLPPLGVAAVVWTNQLGSKWCQILRIKKISFTFQNLIIFVVEMIWAQGRKFYESKFISNFWEIKNHQKYIFLYQRCMKLFLFIRRGLGMCRHIFM